MKSPWEEVSDPQIPFPHVVSFESPHHLYAMAISPHPTNHLIALGSFIEDSANSIDLLTFDPADLHSISISRSPNLSIELPYPPTKLMFSPATPNLLASSGDFLRLWDTSREEGKPISILNNSKTSDHCAPLTSFDWNEAEPRRIGACSVDTTCTVWDVERGVVETQLIAHDKEVYDIAWGEERVFASVSADGSVRLFDLRDKEHSSIIYESPLPDTPLLRLAWNKRDLRLMATTLMDSNKVVILDIRSPSRPVAELECHRSSVNAIAWSPQSSRHICSAGDDSLALIWDLPNPVGANTINPVCVYSASAEINQLQWSASLCDWIAIAFEDKMQLLRV